MDETAWPEYLAVEETPIGLLALRRRPLPSQPGTLVTEITLDHRFLMSSHTAQSERQLAELAIELHGGTDLDVLVGGLGLGHTAHAALATGRAARVEVVELLPAVVGWLTGGLVPLADALNADSRLSVVLGDVHARLAGPPARLYDVILIDVDHSPDDPLGTWPNMFYSVPGLIRTRMHLAPGGVLAVWSGSPSVTFVEDLTRVFAEVMPVPIAFRNAIDDVEETNLVFLARWPR
ncbi:MAG: spermidine synthase [Myxococcota bacterium]